MEATVRRTQRGDVHELFGLPNHGPPPPHQLGPSVDLVLTWVNAIHLCLYVLYRRGLLPGLTSFIAVAPDPRRVVEFDPVVRDRVAAALDGVERRVVEGAAAGGYGGYG